MGFPTTASQTVGPYFSIGLSYRNGAALCREDIAGEHITIAGQVFDGAGLPVPDAQLELWQADAQGRFAGYDPSDHGESTEGFAGFARVPTDPQGGFHFHTIRPGFVPAPNGALQAPHIVVLLSMRGILKHLFTRIYFANDAGHDTDSILTVVPADRRATLLARPSAEDPTQYLWDIHLQGDDETVFFQY